ncbi:MAG: SIMPL domain-containing protein [Prolixibacteraceae bacterium]|nr:SIMPL domain-containing protein [Prolixibacteraceae bacterium]
MKTRILLVLMAVLPMLAVSQVNNSEKETPYIEVVGMGEMEVIPDQIYISFTLKERLEGKKKIEIEDQEKELKKRLMKIGVDLADLQLADANSDFIKIKRKKNEVIASKDYLLKVSSTGALAQVFELLDEISAFNANIQRVDHSEIKKFRKEVKMQAVQDAKEKAGYLLGAIGETVGKPLFIQERETYNDIQPFRKAAMMSMEAMDAAGQEDALPELAFQKIKLKYTVFARFAIKQ